MWHSKTCEKRWDRQAVGQSILTYCICSVKPKLRALLTPNALVSKGPWKGSNIEDTPEYFILTHSSGAVMKLKKAFFGVMS